MNKLYGVLPLIAFLFAACNGGSGSSATPAAVPTATIAGTALDGLISQGAITAYDFTGGVKGSQVGQSTTDNKGLYTLALQLESRPVLLEITGGYYNEEVMPSTNVTLESGDKLTALVNFTTGQSLRVSLTTYTTLAAGLAQYQINKGVDVAKAINDANSRISALIGTNILTTTPLEITDVANASAAMTPGLQYGFLAGGISMWASQHQPAGLPANSAAIIQPYTSIKLANTLYQDIVADGLLDGRGKDTSGSPVSLSFGNTLLGVDVYRRQFAVSMMQMANHSNNKTGLDASRVLTFAKIYASNTDPMFNAVTPVPIESPVVTMITPAANVWLRGTTNVTASIQDYAGIVSDSVSVDNVVSPVTTTNLLAPLFAINTANYTDGLHTITVSTTNAVGMSTAVNTSVGFDNTPPTIGPITFNGPSTPPGGANVMPCSLTGTVTDSTSGTVNALDVTWGSNKATPAIVNMVYSINISIPQVGRTYVTLVAHDVAGNSSSQTHTLNSMCVAPGRGCLRYACVMDTPV